MNTKYSEALAEKRKVMEELEQELGESLDPDKCVPISHSVGKTVPPGMRILL